MGESETGEELASGKVQEDDLEAKKEIRAFVWKVGQAVSRIVAICVFAALHFGLDFILSKTIVAKFPKVETLLETLTLVAFGVIYFVSLLEMAYVFLPGVVQEALVKRITSGKEVKS